MSTATASASNSSKDLAQLLEGGATQQDLAAFLDGLPASERLSQVLALRGKKVKRLYEAAALGEPMTMDDLVPRSSAGRTVIFEGRNSMPLFSRFQKRFALTEEGNVIGYNQQAMSFLTGPGYFHVCPPSGRGPHPGELYFDYTRPVETALAGWPGFRANDRGFSRLVFMNMKDYVRRVARGVCVGKAYKLDHDENAYFVLCLAA